MRWIPSILLLLAACAPASAGLPGWSSGGGAGAGTQWTLVDTLANIEATSPVAGQVGKPTDSFYELRCSSDGTWRYFFRDSEVTKPPSSGWPAFNSATLDGVQIHGGYQVTVPGDVGNGFRGVKRSRPSDPTSAPYYAEYGVMVTWLASANSSQGGISSGFTNGTALAIVKTGADVANLFSFTRFSNATTAAGDDAILMGQMRTDFLLFRAEEDATNRHMFIKHPNDSEWEEFGTGYGRTVTFTADQTGVFARTNDVDLDRIFTIVHYEEGSL